jgi:type II secretory pathway component GspD/PulD (secretin)
MPLFNIILKNNGAALIKQGGVYQIMPIPAAIKRGLEVINDLPSEKKGSDQDAKPDAKTPSSAVVKTAVAASQSIAQIPPRPAVSSGSDGIKGTRLATHAIHVDFVPIKELIEVIKEFMTDGGYILPYERLNLLFVTDYSDSVARIEEIIHMLDNAWLDPDLVELVKVENNASSDVVDDLKKIFGSGFGYRHQLCSSGSDECNISHCQLKARFGRSKKMDQETRRGIRKKHSDAYLCC